MITAALIISGAWLSVYAVPKGTTSAEALRVFLRKHFGMGPSFDRDMRYSFAWVSLNAKPARQVFVYLTGRDWCGSGGCTGLILQPQGDSFRVIDKFTLVRLPIRILRSKTNGWCDITMPVAGGGIIHEYIAVLRFNGHAYHSNPSTAPKVPKKLVNSGTEIPLSPRGKLVY